MPADPVSTGGGGVVLEHRYGAALLASLLAGVPVPALGDDVTPLQVRFQCTTYSPVDDLTVVGRTASGSSRVLSIGVRRTPVFAASSAPTVALISTYVRAVEEKWDEIQAGRLRLGVACLEPNGGVREVAGLAEIARTCSGNADFRTRVAHRSRRLARRLAHFDALVTAASGSPELAWRVLFALRTIDAPDTVVAVNSLREATRERTAGVASTLYDRLARLAGDYAPAGAWVDETVLRKDLDGWPLRQSDSHPRAWAMLDRLVVCLRDRTPPGLRTPQGEFEIDRQAARSALCDTFHLAARDGSAVLITGEPEVGKSALAMRAAEHLPFGNVTLSLRDLPKTMLEFEAGLGADVTEVLAKIVISGSGLLVVDGAEAVLEGRRTMLIDLVTCALRIGLGVAAVTRTDGVSAVEDCLGIAARALGKPVEQATHVVPGLDDVETAQVTTTFAGLGQLAADRRSAWVLHRPGLVDLMVRSGPLLDRTMSEADVFALIWHGLVRDAEKSSPDGREQTLLALARRLLTTERSTLDPEALASLRSDGLLLPRGQLSAWGPGEEFSTDLVRDLAVARLLLVDGWTVLAAAEAPRWALRAARLACQAALPRRDHTAFFEQLAATHGRRWAELPLEAMLTSTDAMEQLERVWPLLSAAHRADLLRLARDRYTQNGVGDPFVLAPLVDLFYCREGDRGDEVRETVRAWLHGVVEDDHVPLRQVVRELTDDLELLALLGADLDAGAAAVLRTAAPRELLVALENPLASRSMAVHCPDLLFDLCEVVYEAADPERYGRARVGACACEPFHALLQSDSSRALLLINRLLAKAAANSHHNRPATTTVLEFPDGSFRSCVGSTLEWSWYRQHNSWEHDRHHCALTAVEQMIDQVVASGVPVADAVDPLLRDCTNLPMTGLAFGLLLRHVATSPSALDTWLCQPDVWQLEKSRHWFEDSLQQGRSSSGLDVLDVPLWSSVGRLVLSAWTRSDSERITAFERIAAELTRRAEADDEPSSSWTEWVQALQPASYDLMFDQGELVRIEFRPSSQEEPDLDSEPLPIGVYFFEFGVESHRVDRLRSDLERLRSSPFDQKTEEVAIAVIATHVQRVHVFSDDDLLWSASRLIDITAALLLANDRLDPLSLFNWDALTTLLLPEFDSIAFDRAQLEHCLTATVLARAVRSFEALSPIWAAECSSDHRCRHELAWAAARSERPTGYAVVQCIEAARSGSCIAPLARAHLGDLLTAYRGKLAEPERWFSMGDADEERAVAGALFSIAADGEHAPLLDHLSLLCRRTERLADFLTNLCWHATYQPDLRRTLPRIWPLIMRLVLATDLPGYQLPHLLPVPRAAGKTDELANSTWLRPNRKPLPPAREVLAAARSDWLDPAVITDLIEQWAERVRGTGSAQDVLVAYARTTSPTWQVNTALPLLEQVTGPSPRFSEHSTPLLPEWLTDLHRSGQLTPAAAKILHRLVDAHVAAGDKRLVPLQVALE